MVLSAFILHLKFMLICSVLGHSPMVFDGLHRFVDVYDETGTSYAYIEFCERCHMVYWENPSKVELTLKEKS